MTIRLPRPSVDVSDLNRPTLKANESFCKEDLARSGLTPEDIPVFAEANKEVRSNFATGVADGDKFYTIPYYFSNGEPVLKPDGTARMFRRRTSNSEFRYIQPSRQDVGDLCTMPYFCPLRLECGHKNGMYVIVEGEKKYAKLLKEEKLYGCAIGGKDNWRGEHGSINSLLLEDINAYAPEILFIVPDGDWHRQDIFASYSLLIFNLKRRLPGIIVRLADLSAFRTVEDTRMGADDYLVAGLAWADVPIVDIEHELLLPVDTLIERFSLDFDVAGGATNPHRVIRQNSSNVEKLFQKHPMFGPESLWYDIDRDVVMWQNEDRAVRESLLISLQRYCHMPKINISAVDISLASILTDRERSPLLEWLKGLVWDGVDRISKLFVDCVVGTDISVEYRIEAAKRLMLQLVARRIDPGCKADTMVIFVGKQGIHKSMFWEILSKGVFAILPGGITDKDAKMVIHRSWIVVAEELDFYHTREAASFKQFLTSPEDTYRPPYGRDIVTRKRRCVIVGNSNDSNFLRDTENRREMPVRADSIDLVWLRDNMEQLYAQAMQWWRDGIKWWNEDGDRELEDAKTIYVEEVPFRIEIEDAIRLLTLGEHAVEIPVDHQNKKIAGKKGFTFDRLQFMLKDVKLSPIKLNQYLTRLGWEKIRVKVVDRQTIAWFR